MNSYKIILNSGKSVENLKKRNMNNNDGNKNVEGRVVYVVRFAMISSLTLFIRSATSRAFCLEFSKTYSCGCLKALLSRFSSNFDGITSNFSPCNKIYQFNISVTLTMLNHHNYPGILKPYNFSKDFTSSWRTTRKDNSLWGQNIQNRLQHGWL